MRSLQHPNQYLKYPRCTSDKNMQLKPSRRTLEITATLFALVILALNIAFKFSATTALRFLHRRTDTTTLEGPNSKLIMSSDSSDRKSTRLNSSHSGESRMPSSA